MSLKNGIYVVIPSYNEGKVLIQTVQGVLERGYHVVVVDDGSTDGTAALLWGLPVHYLQHILNLGQGAALATGIEYALKQGAAFIVTFDADGQHQAEDIPRLLAPLLEGTAEVALGSRFIGGETELPPLRRWLLKLAILFTGLTQRAWFSDVHNGLRAFTAPAARQIRITQNRMAHASEILAEIVRLKLRYVEVPVRVLYTEYSQAKGQRTLDALNILLELLESKIR